mgnify:CR=1 FL=1
MTDGELFEEARKLIEIVKENSDKEFFMQCDLLEKVKRIQKECEKNAKENAGNFNVFEIIRIHHLETRMSFFLLELLKKSGAHNMGTAYLKQFFEDVLEFHDADYNELENAEICWQLKEKTDDEREKHIDIVIKTPYRYIPIEIKIYAGKGENQCYDYFCIGKRENLNLKREWGLFYLTLYGSEPESIKNHEECKGFVHTISWKNHITSWLENLIKITPQNHNNVVEVIKQYRDAIKNLTGQNKEELQMRIEEIIKNSETMQAAVAISDALPKIRKNLLRKIFAELIELFERNYGEVSVNDSYNEKYPSIAHKISNEVIATDSRSYVLAVCFQINCSDGKCDIGFTVLKKGQSYEYAQLTSVPDDVKEKLRNMIPSTAREKMKPENEWWFGYRYLHPDYISIENTPDFKNFNPAYYDLFDNIHRRYFIKQVAVALNELTSVIYIKFLSQNS